jgi:O-antigen/teichoic acid export membrane protein
MMPEISKQSQSSTDERDQYFRTDHLDADLGRRSARGGAVTIGAQALKFIIGTGSTIVLARLLTPQDYGLIGMVVIITNFVGIFLYLGLSTATVRWKDLNHQQVSTLFWINMALSTALMLITVASAPLAVWFYHEPRLLGITICFGISLIFYGLVIQHEAILTRQMRFLTLAIIDFCSLFISLTAAIIAAKLGAGYWALVINQLVMSGVRVVAVWTVCRWRPSLPVRGSGVRSMLSYGGNITGFNLINYFARNLDNTLIGKFWGSYQLGLYSRAYQLLLLPMEQINGPFTAVAIPALSRVADSPERYRSAYLKILEKVAMLTMPGVAFMIATSDWLILLMLGPQWLATGRIFMLLGIAGIMQPVTKTSWWLFSTQGRTREMFHWGMIGGSIAIISILIGLPWGAIGVAAAYGLSDLCLSTPLLFWFVGRRGPIRTADLYRTIVPSACAAVCTLGLLLILHPHLETIPLLARLSIAFAIAVATSLLVFTILPAGRRAMQNFKEMLLLLFKSGKSESAI